MENGTTDNRDDGSASVAKTVRQDATDASTHMRLPWSSQIDANPPPSPTHKRTVSSSLFSRFNFLRPAEPNNDDWLLKGNAPRSKTSIDDEEGGEPRSTSANPTEDAGRLHPVKQRTRKGSLRKSALLGVKRLGAEGRERRNSLLQQESRQEARITPEQGTGSDRNANDTTSVGHGLPKTRVDSTSTAASSGTSPEPQSSGLTKTEPLMAALPHRAPSVGTAPPVSTESSSTTSDSKNTPSYTSTTEDDDDVLSFARPAKPIVPSTALVPPNDATATSYFPPPPPTPRMRTRSTRRLRPSPLQHAHAPAPEPYSYTETEYWGWVILFATWLLFTVGMGSCLDIWSWAWDIGETPYAPPELEDDPTLPIVGYYPALIVLTGVVAWVWITVAWVGMKYFRHAKIEDIR